ncbi:Lymphotactin [Willisornis vidua]|uniref:Lymphotactin n=1 Tax=Willisornis vidua TaxID=1566151 RepID=A0ABQ9DXB4_9PASS|nr:Lymphotactin [Willisornis vidua]
MKLHAAALLAILCLGIFTVHIVKGSGASESMRKGSCVNLFTRQLSIRNLVSYEKQHIPVTAIVFITKRGIRICVSEDQNWVQAAMKNIEEKRTTKHK